MFSLNDLLAMDFLILALQPGRQNNHDPTGTCGEQSNQQRPKSLVQRRQVHQPSYGRQVRRKGGRLAKMAGCQCQCQVRPVPITWCQIVLTVPRVDQCRHVR